MTDLRTWSDEELCQFCIPKDWEDRLESVGCIATPLVSAVVLFAYYLPWRKSATFLEGAVVWAVGTLLLFLVVVEIAGWRCRRHKAELARRYGQREFNVYRRNARHEIRRKPARKIYLFQGRDVEGKQYAFVQITLWATEPVSGRLTVHIAPDFQTAKFRTVFGELVKQERELTQEEATVLLTAHGESAGSRLHNAPKSESPKGVACSVAVLEPSRESMATCDLLSGTALEAEQATLQLTLRLLHLAETVTDHPLVSHWEMPDEDRELPSLELSIESAKRLFQRDDPPDWVILFHGSALPHGGQHILRVVLSETEPDGGRLWTITRAYRRSEPRDPRSLWESHEKELSATEWEHLIDGLHSITPRADLKMPRFPVFDGFPCDLVVLHRSPSEVTRAECNLAGLTEDQTQEPLVKLMQLLLSLRREAGAEATLYGACDPMGNIQIGEI